MTNTVILLGTSVSQSVIVSVLRVGRSGNLVLIPDVEQRLLFSPQPPDQFILCSEVVQNTNKKGIVKRNCISKIISFCIATRFDPH